MSTWIKFLIFLFFVPQMAFAIVNIESTRLKKMAAGSQGSLDLKASGSNGNTDKAAYDGSGLFVWNGETYQVFSLASYKYGETNQVSNTNKFTAHLRMARDFFKLWQWEVFTQWQRNEFQRLQSRTLGGAGLRYQVLSSDTSKLFIGLGAFAYEEELDENVQGVDREEFSGRGNLYVALKFPLAEKLNLFMTSYFQPKLDLMDDHHWLLEAQLKVEATKYLSFVLEYKLAHDNRPPLGVAASDSTYMSGISLKF